MRVRRPQALSSISLSLKFGIFIGVFISRTDTHFSRIQKRTLPCYLLTTLMRFFNNTKVWNILWNSFLLIGYILERKLWMVSYSISVMSSKYIVRKYCHRTQVSVFWHFVVTTRLSDDGEWFSIKDILISYWLRDFILFGTIAPKTNKTTNNNIIVKLCRSWMHLPYSSIRNEVEMPPNHTSIGMFFQ